MSATPPPPGGNFIRNEHPLNNYLVLKSLLCYDTTPATTLRNRLVSKSWLEACSDSWVTVDKRLVLRYAEDDEAKPALVTLPEFYDLYQANDPVAVQMVGSASPSRNVTLYSWEFPRKNGNLNLPEIDGWFWTSFQWLRRLKLVNCHFRREMYVFKKPFLEALPAMEELILISCTVDRKGIRDLDKLHKRWMDYKGRNDWVALRYRRIWSLRPVPDDNIPYFPEGYQHSRLVSLNVNLKYLDETCDNDIIVNPPPMRLWGPLLAMLPKLKTLRIGDYEETEVKQSGYFWELFMAHEIGQVERTLESLDLLDFEGRAQENAVFNSPAELTLDCRYKFSHFKFSKLRKVAIDLGLDAPLAERDIVVLQMWTTHPLKEVHLFRAPFENTPLKDFNPGPHVKYLQLWGNVSFSLDFLQYNLDFERISWITTCYEKTFHGKRIHHMLRDGRKAYPLFKMDLMANNKWEWNSNHFHRMRDLEIDWGPISKNWKRLGTGMPNLERLKAVVRRDEELEEIMRLWPDLKTLEFGHRSQVTVWGLYMHLPKLRNILKFAWPECACTRKLLIATHLKREMI